MHKAVKMGWEDYKDYTFNIITDSKTSSIKYSCYILGIKSIIK